MKAASVLSRDQIALLEIPPPEPKADEVLVRIRKVGLCGTDVHLFHGHRPIQYPLVLGHEGIGVIEARGAEVSALQLGQRVVIEPNFPCGACAWCAQGRGNICPNKRAIGVTEQGCFAEFACVPAAFAWPIPRFMSDDQAVLVEPAAIALHALKVSHAQPGECIAIIGLGTVGLLLCQFALRLGYIVFASDINEAKRHRACALGANVVDSSQSLELAATWRAHHVQYVFECAGAPQTASMAIAHAPRGSAVVLVGLCESAASFSPLRVVREGISLIPSMIYDHPSDFARTISLIDSHAMDMASLISSHYPLTSIESALRHAGQGDALKIVIDVQS